ncbi:MAG: Coenzyme F420 hydrogenase/dehydrogenase, beta subunit C-terminal domain [candidate division KSB1 bacterium]|nr:Coenzyme F420 hydrogenase/dehydrogenase, beta subunit C-terminal domain [candidate division KSB1 bacterium]
MKTNKADMVYCDQFEYLKNNVINHGLCTHCGTCAGLAGGALNMIETASGPLPVLNRGNETLKDPLIYDACPGKGLSYPELNRYVFGKTPENMLLGTCRALYVGYSRDRVIRKNSASGGIVSQVLIYLLQQKMIDGAVIVQMCNDTPWLARPVIAHTPADILDGGQSVYTPVPVNTILAQIQAFDGRLAFVGTPDQVASIRYLQMRRYEPALKIKYIIGLYVGTLMYIGAVESFLKSNRVQSLSEIRSLKYRDGEWPGYLKIELKDGNVLTAKKFYYNYLIPFYITQSSLLSVDFTNELTDISVGDAWSPRYIRQGMGFSVAAARSEKGVELLRAMQTEKCIELSAISPDHAMAMHAHMLDFKKRGAFIRFKIRKALGMKHPDFGYSPVRIPKKRILIEILIYCLFALGKRPVFRKLVQHIPPRILGPKFDVLRYKWKSLSRRTKRSGLEQQRFKEQGIPHDP